MPLIIVSFLHGLFTFSNFSGLKSVFEKLRFRDGLVWTVGLTVEIKLRFRDGLVWTVGLTVEIKLRFRDGLVWTVGLTVEISFASCPGVNPCEKSNGGCEHLCVYLPSLGMRCLCEENFKLNANGKTCDKLELQGRFSSHDYLYGLVLFFRDLGFKTLYLSYS